MQANVDDLGCARLRNVQTVIYPHPSSPHMFVMLLLIIIRMLITSSALRYWITPSPGGGSNGAYGEVTRQLRAKKHVV